jgi:hypothetical protein
LRLELSFPSLPVLPCLSSPDWGEPYEVIFSAANLRNT